MALGLAIGLLWTTGYDLWIAAPVRALDGETESFAAVLRDDPQSTQYGSRVYANAKIRGHRCKLLLYLDDMPQVRAGGRMKITARLALPEGEDYELYYRSIGVDLIAYSVPGAVPVPSDTLSAFPLRLRRMVKDKIQQIFPVDAAPFMQALLIGDRTGLSFTQSNTLNISGIAHTVVISGMHVSTLLGLILLLCGNRRWLSACIGIPVVIIFTLMVGAMPSVVRAAVMQILLLLAPLLMREWDALTSLGFAALCILLPNPWAVSNLSFQLSFGAVLGILLVSAPLYARICRSPKLEKALRRRGIRAIVHYFIGNVTTTIGACLFTIPLIAMQRGVIALFGIVTNLLVGWAVTLVFQAGLCTCILGFVWLWPAKLLAGIAACLVRYIMWVAEGITAFPLAAVYTDNRYMVFWLVFVYLIGACMLLPNGQRKLLVPGICVGSLGLCLCLWLGYLEGRAFDGTLLDVGQGQCLILRDGNVTAMYDCGGSGVENAGETAARFLLSNSITRLDVLVLSHYDTDHAGGVCQLLSRLPVSLLYLPDLPCDTGMREKITETALAQGTEIRYVTDDEVLSFSDSTLHIYAPVNPSSENDASLGLLFSQGDFDLLATGDMTSQAEMRLLSGHDIPDIEVLVAGHHGAATSTCDTLLELTKPETVLISVGKDNPYRHPSDKALARMEAHGAQIYRTDLCGNITIRR